MTTEPYELEVLVNTFAKTDPVQSGDLPSSSKIFLRPGLKLPLLSDEPADSQHVKIRAAAGTELGDRLWYVFTPHVKVNGTEPGNSPQDEPAPTPTGPVIRLPGFSSEFALSAPIHPGGNFTWGEATHGGSRIPANKSVTEGILRIADALEEVRQYLGDRPILINSWYRDPATNKRVGGASQSRHMSGDAVDFRVGGMSPASVYARLNPWWGDRGGLASSSVFTHIDSRGYRARWSYKF